MGHGECPWRMYAPRDTLLTFKRIRDRSPLLVDLWRRHLLLLALPATRTSFRLILTTAFAILAALLLCFCRLGLRRGRVETCMLALWFGARTGERGPDETTCGGLVYVGMLCGTFRDTPVR